MKISTKGRYGLRVMIDLATYSVDKHIPLREISKRQNITIKYLEQIMTPLLRAGYVTSFRGNNGGYQLACAPADVSVGEIIRTMEGSLGAGGLSGRGGKHLPEPRRLPDAACVGAVGCADRRLSQQHQPAGSFERRPSGARDLPADPGPPQLTVETEGELA